MTRARMVLPRWQGARAGSAALASICLVLAACAPAAPTAAPKPTAAPAATSVPAAPGSPAPAASPAASAVASPAVPLAPSPAVQPAASPSAVAAASPGGGIAVEPLAPRASLKLALASTNYVWLPLMVALDKGYFSQAGLDVEVVPITGASAAMLPLLARGDIDISATTPSPATFNQVSAGFDIQVIANGPLDRPGRMASVWLTVISSKVNEIKELSDLRGKTIEAGVAGTPFDLVARSALQTAGLQPDKDVTLTYRIRANSDMVALARNQAADVITMIEPLATQAEKEGLVKRWKAQAEIVPWFEPAQLAVSSQTLQTKRAAVQKFLEVYLQVCRQLNATNGQWTDDLMATATKWAQLPADTIRAVGGPPYFDPNGAVSIDSLDRAQKFLVDQGAMKEAVDVHKLVNTDVLDAAVNKVGRASQ